MVPHSGAEVRVRVDGKFLDRGGIRFLVKGVAYGTFAPDARHDHFPPLSRIAADFAAMARHGINTVRTYTAPDLDVLDCAAEHGLRVMVGLPWAQHRAFLDDTRQRRDIRRSIRADVLKLGRHPAAALFAVGNEIPAPVVRWHGPDSIARFLRQLYDDAKDASPDSLLTYVNFPPTEYLEIPFFDVCAFNVYLHRREDLRAYLTHLQHVAGHKPLLLAEAGADSLREGADGQAALTTMQLQSAFAAGACGAVAFSWTDEWWRGGFAVDDWAFGLVTADRRPKPALHAVSSVFRKPQPHADVGAGRPSVSVVVCAHNAASTIGECLQSLVRLCHPPVEIIVVNDGSTDQTGQIVRGFREVRQIEIRNRGLAVARNLGAAEARGDIVAYTDVDVRVDPDWLTYLVGAFHDDSVAAVGGPNVVPPDDPFLAQCVARSPGGPTHVMLDDHIAEHVPGCNLAIRRSALAAIGGFNPVFKRAGDDVDVCWRLQAHGWKVAFAPSALVWHHHRASIRAYWRQQVGYGEGEVWLRPYHPTRFVGMRPFWQGRIYGPLPSLRALAAPRVNAGVWGTAAFPTVYRTDAHPLVYRPHSSTWQIGSVLLIALGVAGPGPAGAAVGRAALLLGVTGLVLTVASCIRFALATDLAGYDWPGRSPRIARLRSRAAIALLHYLQPLARGHGRLRGRLRRPQVEPAAVSAPESLPVRPSARLLWRGDEQLFWSESAVSATEMLDRVVGRLRAALSGPVEIDTGWWIERDVSVPVGRLARIDLRVLVEDHGAGRCLVRTSTRLRASRWCAVVAVASVAMAVYGLATPGRLVEALAAGALLASGWPLIGATRVGGVISGAVRDAARRAGLQALTPTPAMANGPAGSRGKSGARGKETSVR